MNNLTYNEFITDTIELCKRDINIKNEILSLSNLDKQTARQLCILEAQKHITALLHISSDEHGLRDWDNEISGVIKSLITLRAMLYEINTNYFDERTSSNEDEEVGLTE